MKNNAASSCSISAIYACRESEEARRKLEAAQAREAATLAAQHEAEDRLASAADAEKGLKEQAAAAQSAQNQAVKDLQQAKQVSSRSDCIPCRLGQKGVLSYPAEVIQLAQSAGCWSAM